MATYHCSVKYGKCGYAGLHADYIMREGCYAEGPKKEELVYKESGNLPSWAKENPSYFWNCADKYERANGRAYYEFELALPNELSYEQNVALVHEVIAKYIGSDKAYTFAIHDKKATLDPDKNNCHAHIMFCERVQDKYVRGAEKFFSRYQNGYPHRGGARKDDRFTGKNGKGSETIRDIRFGCADIINKHLEMNGYPDIKVDARSLRDQKEAALNVGDFKLHEQLERKVRIPHLGPKLAAQYKRAVNSLSPEDAERYFLELSDEKLQQVYISKAVNNLQKEIEKLEAERALLTSLSNGFAEVKVVADEKLKANDYYSDIKDYDFVDAIFTPKIDEVKQNIRHMSKELSAARQSISSYKDLETEAYDILTGGKYSDLQNDFALYNFSKADYKEQMKRLEEVKDTNTVAAAFIDLESRRLARVRDELQVVSEKLHNRANAINAYINSTESIKKYKDIFNLLKDRNSLLYDRIRNARDVLKAGYGLRDELMRERSYSRILHDIRFIAQVSDRNNQSERLYYEKIAAEISDIKDRMYDDYFCTEDSYSKFSNDNNERIKLLDTLRETYYLEKSKVMKQLLNENEIKSLAQSFAVNYHDKNLENLSEKIKVVTKEYETEHATFMNMEKPGWFSFDYRSEYKAKEKEVADLKAKVQKLQKKYDILHKNLEQELTDPNVQKRIEAFRKAMHNKNEMTKKHLGIIEENIRLNIEVKNDYVNLGRELEYHYEKRHNEQHTSYALQQIDSLRNKIAEKLIGDPVVRKEVEDSVDKNIEMLKEQSRVYSCRLYRLQRMLLSEDKIEQLAYDKATDHKEKELSRQKDYIDKLHEDYVKNKAQLKTMPDGDKRDALMKKTEKLERRIYNKQALYNETCDGALIIGGEVEIYAKDDIENIGTIKADGDVEMRGENIFNRGGSIAGENVDIEAQNKVVNKSGSIRARVDAILKGESIINETNVKETEFNGLSQSKAGNTAMISAGNDLTLDAESNIVNKGAHLTADGDVTLNAGKDIEITTVANEKHVAVANQGSAEIHSVQHQQSVIAGDNINMNAGNELNLSGAITSAEKDTVLTAGKDVNINAVKDLYSEESTVGSKGGSYYNHNRQVDETVKGTNIAGKENITVTSGNDINIKGSNITSEAGKASLTAEENINIENENEYHERLHELHEESHGFLSSKTTDIYDYSNVDAVIGSNISAGSIDITSGKDTNVKASSVVADNDVNIKAGGSINTEAAKETSESEYMKQVKKSGLLSGGGFGFTIGKEKQKDQYANQNTENIGSTIGSLEGSINMEANKDVAVKGSDIIAGKDINITGQNVDIENTENIYNAQEHHEYKRSGLTISVGGAAFEAVQDVIAPIERANQVEDKRLSALYGIKAGQEAMDIYDNLHAVDKAQKAYDFTKDMSGGDIIESIKAENAADLAKAKNEEYTNPNNWNIGIGFGTQHSESNSDSTTIVSQGSNIKAEGDVTITATEKDLNIKGSNVAGENVDLNAKGDINITSSETTNTTEQNSSSSSASVGVTVGAGGLLGANASYSKGEQEVAANSTVHNESTVTAEKDLTFTSGEDTNIKGGKLSGDKITGEVGGNLDIESKQDSNDYKEESKSGGIGIDYDFGTGKVGVTGGISKGDIDSKYDSVTDQSGIYAGKEGFDINVGENTDLKGGIISSEAEAEKNKISTGTLTYEDIHNKAEYEAGSTGINIDTSKDAEFNEKGVTPNIGMPAEDKAESDTKATIAEGEIEIRDKDKQKQDLKDLNRDTRNSLNKLGEIFDKESIQERQELAGLFGELAYNQIHDMKGTDEQKAAYHALVGGIMSQLTSGDFLAGASAAAVNKLVMSEIKKIAGKNPAMMQWLSAAVGAVVSEIASKKAEIGVGVATSATKNNELYMWQETEKKKIINLLYSQEDSLGIDLQERMFKDLSNVNELFDLDGDYLSGQFNKENITLEEKKKYMNIVGSYLSNSLEDQYIKTVVVRAEKALETNRENMNENEVYIFSDSINVPNPFGISCAVNYTTLITKNGSMILSPGFSVGFTDNINTLLPFSSEVYVGPVNIDLNKGDFDQQIVEMLRGNSGTLSGSLFGAGSVSFAQDGTISNYGYGVSTDVIGGNFAINRGRYIGNLRDYR